MLVGGRRRGGVCRLTIPEEFPAYIRPELLQDVARHIDADLGTKLRHCAAHITVVGIVSHRYCHRRRVADDLRIVELLASGIRVGPEDLSDCVSESRPTASRTALEITGILVKDCRVDRLGHEIADDKIGVSRPEIRGISLCTLSKGWIRIRQLPLARKRGGKDHRSPVERVISGDLELFFGRDWLIVREAGKGPVVGDDPEDALVA